MSEFLSKHTPDLVKKRKQFLELRIKKINESIGKGEKKYIKLRDSFFEINVNGK